MKRFSLIVACILVFLAALPLIIGFTARREGAYYLQQQTAVDDQMVYTAWMNQAAQGKFFFDNRFAVDAQPASPVGGGSGLTANIYFFALGQFARFLDPLLVMTLARLGFGFLFILLLGRFMLRFDCPLMAKKLALNLAAIGGGIGFLVWEMFGRLILSGSPFGILTANRLPIDVWQTEGFVFPSMLTSGLFMASLCLFLVIFESVLDAEKGWKPALAGALSFFALMNFHSYDVLLLALVLGGLLVGLFAIKQAEKGWIVRTLVIACGVVIPALWFIYVLKNDTVFQSRAATLTYADNFKQLFAGILPFALAWLGILVYKGSKTKSINKGALILIGLVIVLFALSSTHKPDTYFLQPAVWVLMLGGAYASIWFSGVTDKARLVMYSWAAVTLVAPYFPALFQRKLAIGLVIPWAILTAIEVEPSLRRFDRQRRNLGLAVVILFAGATSIYWLQREMLFVRENISSTTTHPVYLSRDAKEILDKLKSEPGRKVVIAMPGVAAPSQDNRTFQIYLPDLNPFVAGLADSYAYAGHWSETPDYNRRRGESSAVFLEQTSAEKRAEIIKKAGANYLIAPSAAAYDQIPLADLSSEGKVVLASGAWTLIKLD